MPLVPAKCTSCGATLTLDPAQDAAVCPFCNTPFIVEKAINNYTTINHYHTTQNITAETVITQNTSAEALYTSGKTLCSLNQLYEAGEKFKQMTQDYPEDWRGWWEYGKTTLCSLLSAHTGTDAVKYLQNALKVAPSAQQRLLITELPKLEMELMRTIVGIKSKINNLESSKDQIRSKYQSTYDASPSWYRSEYERCKERQEEIDRKIAQMSTPPANPTGRQKLYWLFYDPKNDPELKQLQQERQRASNAANEAFHAYIEEKERLIDNQVKNEIHKVDADIRILHYELDKLMPRLSAMHALQNQY